MFGSVLALEAALRTKRSRRQLLNGVKNEGRNSWSEPPSQRTPPLLFANLLEDPLELAGLKTHLSGLRPC